jgi:hypothetical protein
VQIRRKQSLGVETEYESGINLFFQKVDTSGYQPWSWYVFMTIGKTPNLKQCSTMNQQRQTSPDIFGKIIVYSIYTHAQFGANEDSWGPTQQLTNWASNF